jgi:hypothetical protein
LGAVIQDKTFYTFLDDKVITAYVHNFEVHPVFRLSLGMSLEQEEGMVIGSITARESSDTIISQKIVGSDNYNVSIGGSVIGRKMSERSKQPDFGKTYRLVASLKFSDLEEKQEVVDLIDRLAAEIGKEEQANVERIERWLRFLRELSPQVQTMVSMELLDRDNEVNDSIRAVALKMG